MIIVLPAYLLLLALGLEGLRALSRWLLGIGLLAPILIAVAVLPAYYGETRYASASDMRSMMSDLTSWARPDAVMVSNLPPSDPTYGYYYRGRWPLVYLPESGTSPPATDQLAGLAAGHSEIWYLPYGGERGQSELWLNVHGVEVSDRWYGNARLVRYLFPPISTAAPTMPLKARFDQGISLAGYTLLTPSVAAGQPLLVTLFWQAEGGTARPYKVFVQLLDAGERLWGQQDIEPGGGAHPTDTWFPGMTLRDTYGLVVQPSAPPGEYRLAVGLYDPINGARLALLTVQDRLLLGPVQVTPAWRPAQ
jgi:hypothetical protein